MSADYFLRELSTEDVTTINSWRNSRELVDRLGANFRYINVEVDKKWAESYFNNRQHNIRLAICHKDDKELLGVVYLLAIDWLNRNCELAIMIGDASHRGKGVGTFAVKEALIHAFNDLNLHRVYLKVLETNAQARCLYERIGFETEGVMKDGVFKCGEYVNVIHMAMLKPNFDKYK